MKTIYTKNIQQNNDFAAGASASINKTIAEIEHIVSGEPLGYDGPKRKELRTRIQDVLKRLSELWYKKGFNRGHKESYRAYREKGRVPRKLLFKAKREFIPNTPKDIKLKSKIKT